MLVQDGAGDYFMERKRHPFWILEDDDTYPRFCTWHYGVSVGTATGPVAPCCPTAKARDDFGCVLPGKTSFADVWNNDRYRHARTVLAGRDPSDTAGVVTGEANDRDMTAFVRFYEDHLRRDESQSM